MIILLCFTIAVIYYSTIQYIFCCFCCCLAALGLCCCVQVFSSCSEQGLLFDAVRGLLIVVASPVAEHQLQGVWASVVVARGLSSCGSQALECRLSSCGTWAQLLRGMWDLPQPGIEPMSLELAGRFLTTVPPGKSLLYSILYYVTILYPMVQYYVTILYFLNLLIPVI